MARWLMRWPRVPGIYWCARWRRAGGWNVQVAEVEQVAKGSLELRYYLPESQTTLSRDAASAGDVRWCSEVVIRPQPPGVDET